MSVLVIQDQKALRTQTALYLQLGGIEDVRTVGSGAEALADLEATAADGNEIAAIIVDLAAPDADPIELCARIAQLPWHLDTPIILCCDVSNAEDLSNAFAAGVMDFLRKPMDQVELVARVRLALRLHDELNRRREREAYLQQLTTALREERRETSVLGRHDPVSAMWDRAFLLRSLENDLATIGAEQEHLGLVVIHLDHFDAFASHYGELAAGRLARRIAGIVRQTPGRIGDLAVALDVGRFAVRVLAPDPMMADILANRLMGLVRAAAVENPRAPTFGRQTVSIGVASAPLGLSTNLPLLLAAAEGAASQALAAGGNRIVAAPFGRSSGSPAA